MSLFPFISSVVTVAQTYRCSVLDRNIGEVSCIMPNHPTNSFPLLVLRRERRGRGGGGRGRGRGRGEKHKGDVVLLARSTADMHIILLSVEKARASFGLSLNLGKTNLTRIVACEGEISFSLRTRGQVVSTPHFPVNSCLDDEAIRSRIKRAVRSFQVWSPMLTNKAFPVAARVAAFVASVRAFFCWQAQNWTPTKKQYNYMSSWASRLGASMRVLRRCPDEPIVSWWRRLHRDGTNEAF